MRRIWPSKVYAVLVTNDESRVDDVVKSVSVWADEVVVEVDREGDFAGTLNKALHSVPEPAAIQVDDDDFYAPNHGDIMEFWMPGRVVWNLCHWYGCDGTKLTKTPRRFLSGSVIPTDVVFETNRIGRVSWSVERQTDILTADMGTKKIQCPGRWNWNDWPEVLDWIACEHKAS